MPAPNRDRRILLRRVFEADDLVGGASIYPPTDGSASIGYWVRVDRLRQGIATMAARAVRDASVGAGFQPALLRHDEANLASGAIAQRLGFTLRCSEPHTIDARGQTGVSLVWEYAP